MASTTLIFDLDGTIWDSRRFYAKVISLAGGDFDQAVQGLIGGLPAARLMREAGISSQGFIGVAASIKDDLELYPSARRTIHRLRAINMPMGIVTSLPKWVAQPMLQVTNLFNLFDTVVGWGRCRSAKPSPKPLLLALQDLNVNPSKDVWYIGDSVTDGQAARAARISFAWASYGYGEAKPVEADKILGGLVDVLLL